MKIKGLIKCREEGYALLMAMGFAGVSLFVLSSTVTWTSGSVKQTERNNVYNRAVAAAEAGTEAVIARMDRDFICQSFDATLTPYRNIAPPTYVNGGWTDDYEFADSKGNVNHTTVLSSGSMSSTNIDPRLPGLYGTVIPCRVISNARPTDTLYSTVAAGVQQDFQLASIPVFQFMAFYSIDFEINPGPLMKITGKVHGNSDLYVAPQSGLEFADSVTAVGKVNLFREAADPMYGSTKVNPIFDVPQKEGVGSLTLPIGTNNMPSEVTKVVDVPPALEDPKSPLGSQRYYNNVDMVATVTSTSVTLKSGRWNNWTPIATVSNQTSYPFIKTTALITDAREGKQVMLTDIDVGALNTWLKNGGAAIDSLAVTKLGHEIDSIYVDDQRVVAGKLTAVRVSNGLQLPPSGLTVATDLPVYVQGNYNAPDLTPGSNNTTNSKPASLVGDSVTVLSKSWQDTNSNKVLSSRPAADTTVNAAFLAGIVQTTNVSGIKHYSGGLENFPRFLEDWGNRTFTYNGSMVVMFPSRFAKSFWIDPGAAGNVYGAPIRKWNFDRNFLTLSKLPPCTPMVEKLIRGQWATVAATGF